MILRALFIYLQSTNDPLMYRINKGEEKQVLKVSNLANRKGFGQGRKSVYFQVEQHAAESK